MSMKYFKENSGTIAGISTIATIGIGISVYFLVKHFRKGE